MPITMTRKGPMPSDKSLHKAELRSIEGLDRPLESDHGAYLRFEFGFISSDYAEWTASAVTSTTLNEYSRLGVLLRAMIGDTAFDGIENESDITPLLKDLIGQRFDVVIAHRMTDAGTTFLDVASVSPVLIG